MSRRKIAGFDRCRVPLGPRTHTLALRMPDCEEMLLAWFEPSARNAGLEALTLPHEIDRLVLTIDGEPFDLPQARAIAADADARAAYRRARNRWLDETTSHGMVYARCPHCERWEADLTPFALAVGLHAAMWPTVDDDQWLAVPYFAQPRELPVRDGTPRAASIRFVIPSARADFGEMVEPTAHGGRFADAISATRLAAVEAERAALVLGDPRRYDDLDASFTGVRTLLRMTAALAALDDASAAPSLEQVMTLPLCDALFVDAAYHLTHGVPVPGDSPLRLRCERCGGHYLPVR